MYDIVADCSDNVPTRYLVNDACVLTGKPLVSASALRMEGQVSVFAAAPNIWILLDIVLNGYFSQFFFCHHLLILLLIQTCMNL